MIVSIFGRKKARMDEYYIYCYIHYYTRYYILELIDAAIYAALMPPHISSPAQPIALVMPW